MKTRLSIILAAALTLLPVRAIPEPQIPAPAGNIITLTTGTAVRFVPNPSRVQPLYCNSIFVQEVPGNTGTVYILNADPSVTMVLSGAGTTLVARLEPVAANVTGASFTYPSNNSTNSGVRDMRYWGVQGATGDTVIATCDKRN